jgi:hypothetical protein
MLLQKAYEANDVVSFKLTSGEELVARLHEEEMAVFVIKKPLALIPGPNGGIGLAPAFFTVNPEELVRLNKTAIAMHAKTVEQIAGQYLQQTTGLAVAKSL